MAKLTENERDTFAGIMKEDMGQIKATMMIQIKDFWAKARKQVEHIQGRDNLMEEKTLLLEQKEKIQKRIHEIEGELNKEDLRPEQIVELGGTMDEYGRYKGANYYGIPVTSQFEYAVVDYIRTYIDLEIPVKFVNDLGRSCIREIAMSGTFEEARGAYEKFYSLDFRKYGVDIPPRLSDVKKNIEALEYTGKTLAAGRNVNKDLIQYKEGATLELEAQKPQMVVEHQRDAV